MNQRPRRRKKLVQPSLQLRLIGSFVGLAGLALFLQFLYLASRLFKSVSRLDGAGGELADELPAMLLEVLAISACVCLPIIFVFGVLLTFRIAGPLYRFEEHLKAVARGEQVGPCKLRDGDHLQSLCDAINAATGNARIEETGRIRGKHPLRSVG